MKSSYQNWPGWRSLLFIPVHIEKFVAKAHTRGADACILDLEDSVPLALKAKARQMLTEAAPKVSLGGADVLVRINLVDELAREDILASIGPAVKALVLPKVESAAQVQRIASKISQLENERGLRLGHTGLIAMIESVEGLANADEIAAASPRLLGLTLGSEDFSASAGMQPVPEALLYPNQQIVFASRRAGIVPLGFPASIADFSDSDAFSQTIRFARKLGFAGALCIHPRQAAILNQEMTPSEEEVSVARKLIEVYEEGIANGRGAVEFEGKMIDMPVVITARELVASHERIRKRMTQAGNTESVSG